MNKITSVCFGGVALLGSDLDPSLTCLAYLSLRKYLCDTRPWLQCSNRQNNSQLRCIK